MQKVLKKISTESGLTAPDRLLPLDSETRAVARALYDSVKDLPIISPHGHCDPRWFAENERFPNPAELFVVPDHYVFRMLLSQGVKATELGVPRVDGGSTEQDPRTIWRLLASNMRLFRATPSEMWLNHSFEHVFGLDVPLSADTADFYYDHIDAKLDEPEFRPRALFERFKIELLSTTESALDDLQWHRAIRDSGWSGQIVTTYRPDAVVDPDFEGYLKAHRARRAYFKEFGATASDHGHPTASTQNLPCAEAEVLYQKVLSGAHTALEADMFRGQVLTEMAKMSLEIFQVRLTTSRRSNRCWTWLGWNPT